jgi:SAM-dependent methyltransferase
LDIAWYHTSTREALLPKSKYQHYTDYVIRDGRLIGEFEEMYRDFADPWHQTTRERFASEKAAALNLLARLGVEFGIQRVVELGCGLGHFTAKIARAGFDVTGLDVSETAIGKARATHPDITFEVARFNQFDRLKALKPDVIVMSEITWYVLDDLRAFLAFIRKELPKAFLIHLLMTYPEGTQKYGQEFFTNLDGILRFFDMRVLESGEVRLGELGRRTYFLGCWQEDQERRWTAE